ncbi:hypothetical protein J7T55_007109 [Diaporthe amygdali]|uniref:uncharacterized protein n=1 Tax=Phomopsis amygdali TaxID=1214568 RepID=UPI0022FF2BA6|nr:uncharacterized protein J7T55_007109 [Diaporthe amygdali]KAJ0107897.1 hypothetical protein J7T55_007109 [Diaporthe amygdali]
MTKCRLRSLWSRIFCSRSHRIAQAARLENSKQAENENDAAFPDPAADSGVVRGTTKRSPEVLEHYLKMLDGEIAMETLNMKRRESMELCRVFIRKHGYPDDHFFIWAMHGVVKVLTEREFRELPRSSTPRKDSFFVSSPESEPYELVLECVVLV